MVHHPSFFLIWHLPTLCIMLWVFCSCLWICALWHLSPGAPPTHYLPFSLPASLQLPSWQTGKQTASFGPVLFLGIASSHTSQHRPTHTHTNTETQEDKHANTSPTPYIPKGVLLTQIRTHQSRPLWNDSGESQVNITACKGQTARHISTHRWSHCLYTHPF